MWVRRVSPQARLRKNHSDTQTQRRGRGSKVSIFNISTFYRFDVSTFRWVLLGAMGKLVCPCFREQPSRGKVELAHGTHRITSVGALQHFPFSSAGGTGVETASSPPKPRGLKPAARNTETGNALNGQPPHRWAVVIRPLGLQTMQATPLSLRGHSRNRNVRRFCRRPIDARPRRQILVNSLPAAILLKLARNDTGSERAIGVCSP